MREKTFLIPLIVLLILSITGIAQEKNYSQKEIYAAALKFEREGKMPEAVLALTYLADHFPVDDIGIKAAEKLPSMIKKTSTRVEHDSRNESMYCPKCGGSGTIKDTCYACRGSGISYYHEGYPVKCSICGGGGTETNSCPVCNGRGRVSSSKSFDRTVSKTSDYSVKANLKYFMNTYPGLVTLIKSPNTSGDATTKFIVYLLKDHLGEVINLKEQDERKLNEEKRKTEEAKKRKLIEQQVLAAKENNRRQALVEELSQSMVLIPGGTFQMGSTSSEADSDEKPVHQVTLKFFYIGKYEVTQSLWEAVMGSNPSKFKGDNHPVEQVSLDDIYAFITKLNQMTGKRYRLPTEAEWEYAARGGTLSDRYGNISDIAWHSGNSGDSTHVVGGKQPNAYGLYDMLGNVWEWCQDWFGEYTTSAKSNPTGPSAGSGRVHRGGSWSNIARHVRAPLRFRYLPSSSFSNVGFRLAMDG